MIAISRMGSTAVLVFLCLSWLPHHACAAATARVDQEMVVLGNASMRVELDASAGGRIRSWRMLPEGRDLIAVWNGRQEIGGALDDRASFTAARYSISVPDPGPERAVVRLEAADSSGARIVKTLELKAGSPRLTVRYELDNGSETARQLFIRNFLLPGTHPQSADHLYWIHGKEERQGTRTLASPDAHGYYVPDSPAWAALWDRVTGDGILVVAPGVSRFYFWRGSRVFPTFEWLYQSIPAGRVLQAEVRFTVVPGGMPGKPRPTVPPPWERLAAESAHGLRPARLTELGGWIDEATRFRVTAAERSRGFWLSTGAGQGKHRLPDSVELDLPEADHRFLGIDIDALRDQRAPLRVTVGDTESAPPPVSVFLTTNGPQRRQLLPIPAEPVNWQRGRSRTLWLRVSSAGLAPGSYRIPVVVHVGRARTSFALCLRVWPVHVEERRPFHVRGYCGGFPVWTGGYEVTDGGLRQLEAILRAYSAMGGDVIDWNAVWSQLCAHVRIEGSGEILSEMAGKTPQRIDLDALPHLDFSYYDPWFEMARKYGVDRVETYMGSEKSPQWSWRLFDTAVGRDRVAVGSPEAREVIVWFFREMKRYFESRGMNGFFCKIFDEIPPERIPDYIETARIVRAAGWRPFTTITGIVARTAADIQTMNPYCDEWQLSFSLKDDFLDLLRCAGRPDRRMGMAGHQMPASTVPGEEGRYAGKPLVLIDPSDEVWCYGGGSHPYRMRYAGGWTYPVITLYQRFSGYGQWAFYHWNRTERIIWVDSGTGRVTVSPAYCGYRDGWRDALLFAQVRRSQRREVFDRVLGETDGALLRVAPRQHEVYTFETVVNADDPRVRNEARAAALRLLAGTGTGE